MPLSNTPRGRSGSSSGTTVSASSWMNGLLFFNQQIAVSIFETARDNLN